MSGMFRDRCDIRRDSSAAGNPIADFTTYAPLYENVPCDVTTVSGSEVFRGKQVVAGTSHVIELHYMPNILPNMQVFIIGGTLADRTLNITSVVPIDFNGRRRKLQLFCQEVQAL